MSTPWTLCSSNKDLVYCQVILSVQPRRVEHQDGRGYRSLKKRPSRGRSASYRRLPVTSFDTLQTDPSRPPPHIIKVDGGDRSWFSTPVWMSVPSDPLHQISTLVLLFLPGTGRPIFTPRPLMSQCDGLGGTV